MLRLLGLSALSVILAIAAWTGPIAPQKPAPGQSDSDLYTAIVARMRANESYYSAARTELTARHYATYPVFNWRLPTLAWLQSSMPRLASGVILSGIGLTATVLWVRSVNHVAGTALLISTLAMLPISINPKTAVFHELWAGALIYLLLTLRRMGYTTAAMMAGLAAGLIRELAIPALGVMSLCAAWKRQWKEAAGWACGLALVSALTAWHYATAMPYIPSEPLTNSWMAGGGVAFMAQAAKNNALLIAMPIWCVAAMLPWILTGLWRVDWRAASVVGAYLAIFLFVGRPDNWYWGFLIGPLLPVSIAGFSALKSHDTVLGTVDISTVRSFSPEKPQ